MKVKKAEIESPKVDERVEALMERLAAPFDSTEVKFKPAVVSGNRALALAYIDARVIQDRLDEVLGVTGWQDEYECLPDGSVVCRLRLKIGDEWITKMDVGGPSEQPDEGDRRKAAFSDALKRAAVKFGVGRYLYRLPSLWVDYDPQKRQFVRPPTLPPAAMPQPDKKLPQPSRNKASEARAASDLPASGPELMRRPTDYDAKLGRQGLCRPGELLDHVVRAGMQAGYGPDPAGWSAPAIALAVEQTRSFEARVRQSVRQTKEVA